MLLSLKSAFEEAVKPSLLLDLSSGGNLFSMLRDEAEETHGRCLSCELRGPLSSRRRRSERRTAITQT